MVPEKNIFQRTSISAVIICAGFLAFSLLFLLYMMQRSGEESIAYLRDVAQQNRTALEKQVLGDLQTLEGLAIIIGEGALFQTARLMDILKKINDGNTFIRMGLADMQGKTDLLDINGTTYFGIDLSEKRFLRQAAQGKAVLSSTARDMLGEGYVHYYAVPIRRGGIIIGVLCGVNSSYIFSKIVDAPIFNGRGFSNIVDSRGKFVIRSRHADMHSSMLGLDDMGSFAPEERTRVDQALRQRKGGVFTYTAGGEPHMAVFMPTAINDWFVVSVISRDVIKQRYSQTAVGTLLIIAAALLIFLFFLYRLNHIIAKNRTELEHLAYTDPLTGCRNYQKFLQDAAQFLLGHSDGQIAVWYLDLKKFKYFNEMFGYQAGDALLRHLTSHLEKKVETYGLFCRIAADNFAGMRLYHKKKDLVDGFHSLSAALSEADIGTGVPLHMEMSMGLYCLGNADKELSVNDMVNRANMAQQSVKALGGSHYAFFNRGIRDRILRETEMESLMETALEKGEFKLYLQPKVNIQQENRVVGAEVLTRWDSREKGLLFPADFIPLFEKNGFIVTLDRYMFERICHWLHARLQAGGPPLNIAVNVSRLELLRKDFIDYYISVKERYAIPDHTLELEFTESLILEDNDIFRKTVIQLQKKGFLCSLDDFGAGYSSLNVLKDLPIEVLKLDILFFRENPDVRRAHTVIAHIIAMARELHVKTIAEGVETASQVDFLRAAGCDLVQGHVFSEALPLKKFEAFLANLRGDSLTPAPVSRSLCRP